MAVMIEWELMERLPKGLRRFLASEVRKHNQQEDYRDKDWYRAVVNGALWSAYYMLDGSPKEFTLDEFDALKRWFTAFMR